MTGTGGSFYQQLISNVNNLEDRKLIKGYYDAISDGVPGFESRLNDLAVKYMSKLQVKLLLEEPARLYKRRRFDVILTSLYHGMGFYSKEEAVKFAQENGFSTLDIELVLQKGQFVQDHHKQKIRSKLNTGLPQPRVIQLNTDVL